MHNDMSFLLHGNVAMPRLGLGVFQTPDGETVIDAVGWAFEAGYRLIDTAAIYRNEHGVGQAITRSSVPRDDLFVTTKVWNTDQGYGPTLAAFEASRRRLGLDYVDLYLIHWPKPEYTADTWRALEHLRAEGSVRAIGVSNFEPHHLDALMAGADVAPSVNQVELHPYFPQRKVRAACDAIGCVVQAWSPLGRGAVLDDPVLVDIARSHGVTPAQVTIRWELQSGISTIPKSVRRERIIENGDVFGFELSEEQMARVDALDREGRIGPHPDHIDF